MKKAVAFLWIALVSLLLTGCLEATEDLTIDEKGAGVYQVNTNLSGMFDFIDMMKAMDTSGTAMKELRDMDTVVNLKSFTDTSSSLTSEQKALMREATLHLVMNQANRVFQMNVNYPYKKPEDVQKIINLNQSGNSYLGKALLPEEALRQKGMDQPNAAMPDLNGLYDVSLKKGVLDRKVNKEKLKAFQSDSRYAEMKQMSSMFSSSSMSTVIHLPRPAKKAEGSGLKLSDDRKTVTIKVSLSELLDDPALFAYHVEY